MRRIAFLASLVLAAHPASAAISTVPSFVAQSEAPGPFRVSTAGDVNGDGYSDLIVGAPAWSDDPDGAPSKGRISVYLGSASGLVAEPAWEAAGSVAGTELGSAVSTAGDLDGDGFDDIFVAARGFTDGGTGEGAVFVWLGAADFASAPDGTSANADWRAVSDQPDAEFGTSIANAGDLNGDGFADLVVGASHYDVPGPGTREGAAFVWLGSSDFATRADGSPADADWRADGSPSESETTPDAGSRLGFAVSGAGDVDADGYDDLLVSAPYYESSSTTETRRVMLWRGEPDFAAPGNDGTTENADWDVGSFNLGITTVIGFDVRRAGDVDGDGLADVVIGGPDEVDWVGFSQVWVFRGNATTLLEAQPSAFLIRDGYVFLGTSVSTAGDVNGDGRADLIVGFPSWPPTVPPAAQGTAGGVSVHLGDPVLAIDASPYVSLVGFADGARMGSSVSTAGDVNGDGYGDIVIAGSGVTDASEARVYHGGGDTVALAAGFSTPDFPASSEAGSSLAAAGDLNGDGYGDHLIGAPRDDGAFDDAGSFRPVYGGSCGPACGPPPPLIHDWIGAQADERLGASVAGAGDVNGDGFDDALVGAPRYDVSHPPADTRVDAGRVRLYLGTASGLSIAAALDLEGDEDGAEFGGAVASAGDVNGDGHADVLVGEPYADAPLLPDAGRVSLYLGRPDPIALSTTPAWVTYGTRAGGHFGFGVASAGDVDRDGRSDVIIAEERGGALGLGAAHLYLGNASGLSPMRAQLFENDSSQGVPAEPSGTSVSSAGDVNGDGYADIVVGFPSYVATSGATSADGLVRVYLGGAPGPDAIADTEVIGDPGMHLGFSVSGGGDFDGDGYSDITVGAPGTQVSEPGEGAVFVFHGSAAGIAAAPSASLADTPGESSEFGHDVASALDTNGDGFADLVASAPRADAPLAASGNTFVHFGNGRAGLPRVFRQTNLSGSPIALLGTTGQTPDVEFQIRTASPTSPAGRVARGIETQAAPLGVAFADGESRASAIFDPGPGGAPYQVSHSCSGALPCRWRARVTSTSPFFPRSPWLSIAGNAPLEADLRVFVDGDADGASEQADNCPYEPNPDQTDAGGIASDRADGIGDACQCGDAVSNGVVETPDVDALRAAFAGLETPAVSDARKCNVIGPLDATDGADFDALRDDCDLVDVVVTRRRIAGNEPTAIQVCEPALP
jgi:hypothetical protein